MLKPRRILRPLSGRWLVLLIGGALVAGGCDLTGQYEANVKKALEKSGQQAKFDMPLNADFHEVLDAEGKPIGVKLRLPKVFDSNTKKKTAADLKADAKALGAAAMVAMTGYVLERPLDDQNGKFQPVMAMFMPMPKRGVKGNAVEAITKPMAAMMPGATMTDVEVETPTGQKMTLKRLRMTGLPQPDGQKKASPLAGGLSDFYFVEGSQYLVMIGWFAPKGQTEKYQLEQSTQTAMGTVEISEAPPADDKAGGKAGKSGCW